MTGKVMDKKYYELELVAYFSSEGLLVAPIADLAEGDALDAVKDGIFAEVNIPYHTGDSVYCFTFHIFNKLNHEVALTEMLALQNIIGQVHRDFGHLRLGFEMPGGEQGERSESNERR